MAAIAVIGGEGIASLIRSLYTDKLCKIPDLLCLDSDCDERAFEIVIVNSDKGLDEKLRLLHFTGEMIFIVNADCKNLLGRVRGIALKTGARIVTYGFNPKSCVTASSVASDDRDLDARQATVQYCIQRRIPTLTGGFLDEQEFSVDLNPVSVSSVLAAVTAALIDGIEVEKIISF